MAMGKYPVLSKCKNQPDGMAKIFYDKQEQVDENPTSTSNIYQVRGT